MANTIGGINLAQIAQESLKTLVAESPLLAAFSTDFSAGVADAGESISTRVANSVTAVDASAGYDATDVTSTAKTITLSSHVHFTSAFTDLEVSRGGYSLLERTFARPAVYAVMNKMTGSVMELITAANFSANTIVASADFDSNDVADIAGALSAANVSRNERSLILGSAYHTALAKDDSVKSALAFGSSSAIQDGRVARLAGLDVYEYSAVPANSQNLVGFACNKEALLVASRQPSLPANFSGQVESVTAPNGLTIQYRTWYENKEGKHYITATLIYGVAVGVPANLHRILSA